MYPFSEIDKQIDALRPGLSGGEMAQLIAMKEIDRLLDIRRQLAEIAVSEALGEA